MYLFVIDIDTDRDNNLLKIYFLLFNCRLDYCGIALLIMGSFVPWLYYGFYCDFQPKLIYLTAVVLLGITTIVVSLWEKFSTPTFRPLRAGWFPRLLLSKMWISQLWFSFIVLRALSLSDNDSFLSFYFQPCSWHLVCQESSQLCTTLWLKDLTMPSHVLP